MDEKKDISLGKVIKNGFLKSFDFSSNSTGSEYRKWNFFWAKVYWLLIGIGLSSGMGASLIAEDGDFNYETYSRYKTLTYVAYYLLIALIIILVVPTIALWKRYLQGWFKTLLACLITMIVFPLVSFIVGGVLMFPLMFLLALIDFLINWIHSLI